MFQSTGFLNKILKSVFYFFPKPQLYVKNTSDDGLISLMGWVENVSNQVIYNVIHLRVGIEPQYSYNEWKDQERVLPKSVRKELMNNVKNYYKSGLLDSIIALSYFIKYLPFGVFVIIMSIYFIYRFYI